MNMSKNILSSIT